MQVIFALVFAFVNPPQWPEKLSPGTLVNPWSREATVWPRNIPIIPVTVGDRGTTRG